MTGEPQYIIKEGTLKGLESAGQDLTGDTFATEESKVKFVRKLCKEVRSHPYNEQAVREKVLDELIDHYEKLIESGKGVTYHHSITYEWMYRGIVVDYLKGLRQGEKE